jgi:hypothetical protein
MAEYSTSGTVWRCDVGRCNLGGSCESSQGLVAVVVSIRVSDSFIKEDDEVHLADQSSITYTLITPTIPD